MQTIDYDEAVVAYQTGLVEKLRGFRGGGEAFLEHWVPDPDHITSITAMLESAAAAGLEKVAIQINTKTLATLDRTKLEQSAARLGNIESVLDPNHLTLCVRLARPELTENATLEAAHERAHRARQSRDRRLLAQSSEAARHCAPYTGLNPAYKDAIDRVLSAPLKHESEPNIGCVSASTKDGTLWAVIDQKHIVIAAGHNEIRDDAFRAFAELLCRLLPGHPILECADHAIIRLERELRDLTKPPPVSGVLIPESIDPIFAKLSWLVRRLLYEYRNRTGYTETENRFDAAPGPVWHAMSIEERLRKVQGVIDHEILGLHPGDVVCTKIDQGDTRITVAVRSTTGQEKARLLMNIENVLKRTIEQTLYVVHEEMRDLKTIRRI